MANEKKITDWSMEADDIKHDCRRSLANGIASILKDIKEAASKDGKNGFGRGLIMARGYEDGNGVTQYYEHGYNNPMTLVLDVVQNIANKWFVDRTFREDRNIHEQDAESFTVEMGATLMIIGSALSQMKTIDEVLKAIADPNSGFAYSNHAAVDKLPPFMEMFRQNFVEELKDNDNAAARSEVSIGDDDAGDHTVH